MHHRLDMSQFREKKRPALLLFGPLERDTIAVLLKGQTIIAKTRFKSGVAGVLAVLTAAKERLEGERDTFDGILQDLGRHFGQIGAFFFACWQFSTLLGKVD